MDIFKIMPNIEPIKVIDIGAMFTGKPIYDKLLQKNMAKVIGFEPNKIECEKLNNIATNQGASCACKYYPYVIGDGTTREFYITNTGYTSSLYLPNIELLEKFHDWSNLCDVVNVEKMETKRLDDVAEVRGADYLKVDVQGAEKDIFENALEVLQDILVIHTEVEFISHYKDQPLFADVDIVLRKNGFQFNKFAELHGKLFKPFHHGTLGQIAWGDAVYVKDFMNLENLSPDKLLKLAVILHEIYASKDICHYVLSIYDKVSTQPQGLSEKYRKHVLKMF